MPIYRYEHDCGLNHDQFLRQDVSSIILDCERCGRQVTARQVMDSTATIKENNEVAGVLRRNDAA